MGRTATAFLMLVAVGGCVADNQGLPAAFQTVQKGQTPAPASCYATWSKPDQFAVLHDDSLPPPSPRSTAALALNTPPLTSGAAAAGPTAAAAASPKMLPAPMPPMPPMPLPVALGNEVLPPLPAPTPPPTTTASDFTIDPDLARATMVQAPPDRPEAMDSHSGKVLPKSLPAKKTDSEVEQASLSTTSPPIRMLNTKRVTLNYELKDIENSGVSGVELWCTRDAHSWERGEIVAQTNHSFSVEVKDEGLHGFTLVARNGSDNGKEAPIAGEQPQIWVMTDFTKPTVQITGVEVVRGSKTPTIQLHWTAKDKNLSFRPITLSYAEQPEGPWTKIAAGMENSGQYEWQPPAAAPHHLFLRVEAGDMAGNVGMAQTANALRLDTAATVAASTPASSPPPSPVSTGDLTHKLVPAPPALDAPRPNAAILTVEPNGN